MADNYLEKRYEEVFGRSDSGRKSSELLQGSSLGKKATLDVLLARNRSYRGYDKSYVVHSRQLEAIVSVNTKIASSVNMQKLRFRLVTQGPHADIVNSHIRMGRALPQLNLPFPGTEPQAFIVVCSALEETPGLDIDLGISLQSMLLKAVDMGLGGLIIRNFDKEDLQKELDLPMAPIAVLAIGKPAEKIELVNVREGDDLRYYRKDGVHYVPKIITEDLII